MASLKMHLSFGRSWRNKLPRYKSMGIAMLLETVEVSEGLVGNFGAQTRNLSWNKF